MKEFAQKHKGLITFVVAILAACYSHFVEPIPQANDQAWDALLGIVAAGSAVHAGKSLGIVDILGLLKKILNVKDVVKDAINQDANSDPDVKDHN
jgi:hypothetical protein